LLRPFLQPILLLLNHKGTKDANPTGQPERLIPAGHGHGTSAQQIPLHPSPPRRDDQCGGQATAALVCCLVSQKCQIWFI